LGVARAAIDDLLALGRKVPTYTQKSLRDRSVVQMRVAQAEAELSAARALFYETYRDAWEAAHGVYHLDIRMKARCQMASVYVATTAARVVDLVHSCAGASGIREEQKFQRHFRDAHVITQHALIAESRLEAVGQIMFGLEPDWPHFAF
jgi:alkylation response protein AidB-like acyl-CoA dehydrogenase